MRYYDSKKIAFPHTCSQCGKSLRRTSKDKQGYLCKKCGPPITIRTGEHTRTSVCTYCPLEEKCSMRVSLGLWLCCETPDFADLERLQISGGLNNERVREAVDASLDGRGSRKILEAAISESAPEIYQGIIEGIEGQKSIGIRVDS
jgi:DNA-directed RNA polymerase subunit RPC12/RpoP